MLVVGATAAVAAAVVFAMTAVEAAQTPKTSFFNQTLDHFNVEDNRQWQQRYLSYDAHWDGSGKLPNGCKGPVLLCELWGHVGGLGRRDDVS